MQDRLQSLEAKYASLTRELMDPAVQGQPGLFVEKAKAQAELESVVHLIRARKERAYHLEQAREMLASVDAALTAMAMEEIPGHEAELARLDAALKLALLPRDPSDGRPVYLEIRAGTGGDEASLFAGVLARMYTRYAEARRWGGELVSSSEGEKGGFKEAILLVKGADAWRELKHEAGVHRVQRVPVTEAQGRIHTSTATVMALPEAE